jgi:hypothetical protein
LPPESKPKQKGAGPNLYPTLESIEESGDGKTLHIKFKSPKGLDRNATLHNIAKVSAILERWQATGLLPGPDRAILKEAALSGFGSKRRNVPEAANDEATKAPQPESTEPTAALSVSKPEPPEENDKADPSSPSETQDAVTRMDVQFYIALIVSVAIISLWVTTIF